MEVSQMPNVRPFAILDLSSTFLDHPWSIFASLYWYAKLARNPCSSFCDMDVWIFCALCLKMPIHAPKSNGGTKSPKTPSSSGTQIPCRDQPHSPHQTTYHSIHAFSTCAFSALMLLVGWQEWHPKKTEWWDSGMVIYLGWDADLHMDQLPLTISCSRKSWLVLPSWFYLFGTGSPG